MSQQKPSSSPVSNGGVKQPLRPAFSKQAIAGFVVACISMAIFGFIAVAAVFLCVRALGEIRAGVVRGRGLAIAGIAVGVVSFAFYVVNMFMQN
ncbi:DUF4190 domain-containing protein [Arthrobacter glacialis]|uniref:DUF4190 domain-containing protein n=1 Tax=Arthrobacter glacialis TaxID=1664 RepID=UPI000CD41C2C|nr:DUF4190 domain-containing protein [Arthrobacter glacialis]POH57659.1 hypothetical protein CVS28_14110 [Arthrobacter glacialis]